MGQVNKPVRSTAIDIKNSEFRWDSRGAKPSKSNGGVPHMPPVLRRRGRMYCEKEVSSSRGKNSEGGFRKVNTHNRWGEEKKNWRKNE